LTRLAAGEVVSRLLAWYAEVARDLPWRRDPAPYPVLLSELMLQQTRVETVIPYFERFLARWPTLEALAAASEEEVLHAWSGLGYYSRARNLHRCAQAAAAAGGLPRDPEALRALPGIGPYTAGAVASIAFGVRAALVDGNVERVISRLDALAEDPKGAGRAAIWARAGELHETLEQGQSPGALNQALMELGATICVPRNAKCGRCPLSEGCLAREQELVESLPTKGAKKPPREVVGVTGIVCGPQGFLLGRRPKGLLGGLWEPIGTELEASALGDGVEAVKQALLDRAGVEVISLAPLGPVVHVFTHRRLTTHVFDVEISGEPRTAAFYEEVRWVADPASVPLSTLAHKILRQRSQPTLLAAERTG
jgi:A/G-specific adenine glycosylase